MMGIYKLSCLSCNASFCLESEGVYEDKIFCAQCQKELFPVEDKTEILSYPEIVGYQIKSSIKNGVSGASYTAVRLRDNAPVYIKVLHDVNMDVLFYLLSLKKKIDHIHNGFMPRILEISCKAPHYVVMEYIEGESLEKKAGRLGKRADWAAQIVQFLVGQFVRLEADGIVHGDIKPANIIHQQGNEFKLVDFSIRHQVGNCRYEPKDELYIAPEVLFKSGPVTSKCDVYSLAAVFYFLLTGSHPFAEYQSNPSIFLKSKEFSVLPPLREMRDEIRTVLERAIHPIQEKRDDIQTFFRRLQELQRNLRKLVN